MPTMLRVPTQNSLQYTLDAQLAQGATSSLTFNQDISSIVRAPGRLVVDRINSANEKTPSKREFIGFTGVSGATVTGLTRGLAGSTDQVHAVGAIVEFVPDVETINSIYDVFDVEHNPATGAHQLDSLTAATTDTDLTLAGNGVGLVKANAIYGAITADTDGATITFNMATSNKHSVTLGGNRTLAVSNVKVGQVFTLRLLQDGTGSRTVTWFSTIKWAGGTVPTLTTTASKADMFIFVCTGSGTYDGFIVGQNL